MTESGKPFVSPVLTKREPSPRLVVWCDRCNNAVEHWVLCEGPTEGPALAFHAYCHSDSLAWGIDDVNSFMDMLAMHRATSGVIHEGRSPLVLWSVGNAETKPD